MPVIFVFVFGIIFTKHKTKLDYTISQHIGSSKLSSILFGITCIFSATLFLIELINNKASSSLPASLSVALSVSQIIFAICLVGIGIFPHLPDENAFSSRAHKIIVRVQFASMFLFYVLNLTSVSVGLPFGVLVLIAFLFSLSFCVLYIAKRKILKPQILIWESVTIALFFIALQMFYSGVILR